MSDFRRELHQAQSAGQYSGSAAPSGPYGPPPPAGRRGRLPYAPRKPAAPSKLEAPDLGYLNAEDMWDVVTRDATCLNDKWGLLQLAPRLRDKGEQWTPTVERLRAWVIEQAIRKAEGHLKRLADGSISWRACVGSMDFRRPIAFAVLIEYLERGPEDRIAAGVRQWLLRMPDGLARELFYPDSQTQVVLAHLPRWIAKFPQLEKVRKRILAAKNTRRGGRFRGMLGRRGRVSPEE